MLDANSYKTEIELADDTCPLEYLCNGSQPMSAALLMDISRYLAPNHTSIKHYAKAMGISSKKLQRLLKEENITFSMILDLYRKNQAKTLLQSGQFSVKQVASKLGYSSGESFNFA